MTDLGLAIYRHLDYWALDSTPTRDVTARPPQLLGTCRYASINGHMGEHNYKRVGILCTNTPAFLEAIFGIGAAVGVNIAVNYRLKAEGISCIFQHSDAEAIIVDAEYLPLLADFEKLHPNIAIIVDTDTDTEIGPYDKAVQEGLAYDQEHGSREDGKDSLPKLQTRMRPKLLPTHSVLLRG